jgi:succinoglycan biosynthesis transport protein ExoP
MFHETQLIKSATIELPDPARTRALLQPSGFDSAKYWAAIRDRKTVIVATTLLSLLAAAVFILVAPAKYTATAQILIDPSDLKGVENSLMASNQMSDLAVLQVESQVRVLTSDNVLRRVIAAEKLDSDPKFARNQTSLLRDLMAAVLTPFGIAHATANFDPALAALYELQQHIRVKRAERTYVVDVSVTTDDGDKSARIANAVTAAYLAEQTSARSEAARRVSDSLAARLSELKNRVRMAEERVEDFKARNNIVGASGQLVNEQQLSELNNQLSLARARTAEAKSRFEQVAALQRSGTDIGAFTEAVQSQTMTALRSQYADVMRREAEQTTTLGPRHPAVIEIRAQAQRLRRVIAEEINRIFEAARSDYERARSSEEGLARSLEMLKRNTLATNEARVALRELERDVQASRAVYESFLMRARETGEQERLDTKNVRIISRAEAPLRRSSPPSFALIGFAALVLGVSAGTGLALVRGPRDEDDRSPPVARATLPDFPLLAALPKLGAGHPLKSFEGPNSRPAAEIRKLHDSLRGNRRKWAGQSILLISAHEGNEVTAIGFNLAVVAAANQSVLLIDADVRRQPLATIVSQPSQAGLIDVASGQKVLSEAVVRDPQTNISLLPLAANKSAGYRDVKDEDIKAAFAQTKRFDLVIVLATIHDPIGAFFAALVDQIVVIAKEGGARKRDLDAVVALLGSEAHRIKGTVLTNAKT